MFYSRRAPSLLLLFSTICLAGTIFRAILFEVLLKEDLP